MVECLAMGTVLRFRGRDYDESHVSYIRNFIAERPEANRRALSLALCEAWDWKQENGALRDGVCRQFLLALHRADEIALPAPLHSSPNPAHRRRPEKVEVDSSPLSVSLRELGPLEIRQVRRTPEEGLVNGLLQQHHYLGYRTPVGEHLKYLVTAGGRPLGCFSWSSAPRHLAPRDQFIGWSAKERKEHIRFIAYQTRFLILPWVRVPHLASHLLGRMSRRLSSDWESAYNHPIYLTETFVDSDRNSGTCYRASNWVHVGLTTGRGKNDQTKKANRSLEHVFCYPMSRGFRRQLSTGGAPR